MKLDIAGLFWYALAPAHENTFFAELFGRPRLASSLILSLQYLLLSLFFQEHQSEVSGQFVSAVKPQAL